jgi:peptide/nickel transport system substrate-binding protein
MLRALLILLLLMGPALAQGVAVIAVQADPDRLNPAAAEPPHPVANHMFSGLVLLDEAGTPRPDLAAAWREETPLRWRFTLREDARWHDGAPVTADDVVFSFREVLFLHHARARVALAPNVAAIEAPDARSVVFTLRRPDPAFLLKLDVTAAPILPRRHGADPASPVGSGPFRLVEHRRDDRVVLARVRGEGVERLVFRIIPDAATQAAALQRGEVDYIARVAPADVARLAQAPGVTLRQLRSGPGGGNCVMTLVFNTARVTLPLRRALAQAVNREALLARLAFGQGRVAQAHLASGLGPFHLPDALAALPMDRAAARAEPIGTPPPLDLLAFASFGRWAEALREDAAAIGLTLRPRLLDPAGFAEAVFARQDFDLALVSYCQGAAPSIGARRMFDWSAVGAPFGNAALYRDAEIQALLEQDSVPAWHAIQRRAADDLPYWPLVETDFTVAWRDATTGWAPWSGRFADATRVRP